MLGTFPQRFAAGLSVLAVSGCVSVLPVPDAPDALYRIDAAIVRPSLTANLIIREPDAPQIIAGQALVSEDTSGAVRFVPAVEWAGRSTRLLQLALVDSFAVDGDGAAVLPESGVSAKYELPVRVQRFGFYQGDAVCAVSVGLLDASTGALIEQMEVLVQRPVMDTAPVQRAADMKATAEQCVEEISVFAARALRAVPSD